MKRMEIKKFERADEVRPFTSGSGQVEILKFAGGTVGKGTFKPGWKWSTNVQPIAGTKSCESAHSGYVISGRMTVVMDGGQTQTLGPGDVVLIPPGHDAWVEGDEACVMLDFTGMEQYAVQPFAGAGAEKKAQPEARH